MENNVKVQDETQSLQSCVSTRTYHFLGWVDGKYIDEQVQAVDRKEAISIMKCKYPKHEFTYVCELS